MTAPTADGDKYKPLSFARLLSEVQAAQAARPSASAWRTRLRNASGPDGHQDQPPHALRSGDRTRTPPSRLASTTPLARGIRRSSSLEDRNPRFKVSVKLGMAQLRQAGSRRA